MSVDTKLKSALKILSGSSGEDVEKGLEILEKISQEGHPRGLFEYAKAQAIYLEKPDHQKIIQELEAAAKAGSGKAAWTLGILFEDGALAEFHIENSKFVDQKKSKQMQERAFELKFPSAIFERARNLFDENSFLAAKEILDLLPAKLVSEDPDDEEDFRSLESEIKYLKKNLKEALDFQKRISLLEKKAKSGDMESAFILGVDLLKITSGREAEGKQWLEKAAASGHHRAKQILKNLKSRT